MVKLDMPLSREYILDKFSKTACVAICGVATAGKDTFFALLQEYLSQHGLTLRRFALADKLKEEINPYLTEQFGISAFTKNPEEKKLIRPSLVAHGFVRRQQSKGTYWTKQLEEPLRKAMVEGVIPAVTDIRYAEFAEDEIYWVRKFGGKLVYITRYTVGPNGEKVFVQPPNEDERRNDPKLRAQADHIIEWDTVTSPTLENLGLHIEAFIKAI
jgi:hypothetical protein